MKIRALNIFENRSSREGDGENFLHIVISIIIVIAVCVAYWQVQGNEFINFDDTIYVTENKNIKQGFSSESLVWAITTTRASNWHPVTWLSHMLDYQIYGLKPLGHHLTNTLFHIANALLLYLVLVMMTGAVWQSSFVAILFAVHPLNVESVAWIAERKNVLSTFFWFLTILAYVRYCKRKSVTRYLLALLFFIFGLMSKPMLVTLPFVLLMLDYWPLNRFQIKGGNNLFQLVLEKTPFIALVLISCVTTFVAQKGGGSVQSIERYPLSARFSNAIVSYIEYLEKMVWPKNLSIFYPHPGNLLPIWKIIVCAILLIGISVFAIKMIQRAPYIALGWFWYLGTLVPVIGIVQVGAQSMADRYVYVPLIGVFISIAWGTTAFFKNYKRRNMTLSVFAVVMTIALMIITWNQTRLWKNSLFLFNHAIEVTENKYPSFSLAHNNLAVALKKNNRNDEAIFHYREAVKLDPKYAQAYSNLGSALRAKGEMDAAMSNILEAIKLSPKYSEAHYNLATILSDQGKYSEAIYRYTEAIKYSPEHVKAYYNLGTLQGKLGNFSEATKNLKIAVKMDSTNAFAHNNLGLALSMSGKPERAIIHLREAIRLKPDFEGARKNLRLALSSVGKSR
ncbi:MAG: tetratricopeptide repeat protein [Nitrospinales bacterium]